MAKKRSGISRLWSCTTLALLLLAVIAGVGWAIWSLTTIYVSPTAARAWALVATVLLPVTLVTGYTWGQTESRGRLRGIDQGIERVVKAAATAIDLRATSVRATRQATQPDPPPVTLPPPDYMERRQLTASNEIIDL